MDVGASNASELTAALKSAHSGDVIHLAAGDYGSFATKNLTFKDGVTVVGDDPAGAATFSGLSLTNVDGLTIRNIEVIVPANGKGVQVSASSSITLDGLNVHGSIGDGLQNDGSGIYIRSSDYVTVMKSDLHDLTNGVYHDNSDAIVLWGNTFHEIGQDGIRGGGTSNIVITANYFTNFDRSSSAHPDAIQFWTTNTAHGVHDITITNNVFERGDGGSPQGIFLGNEWKLTYTNVTITGNVLIGGLSNGLSVDRGRNVTIADNVVLGYTDLASKIRVEHSDNVTLSNNTTSHYVLANNVLDTFHKDGTPTVAQLKLTDDTSPDRYIAAHGLTDVVANATAIVAHDDLLAGKFDPPVVVTVEPPAWQDFMSGGGLSGWLV